MNCPFYEQCLIEKKDGCEQPIGCAVFQTIRNVLINTPIEQQRPAENNKIKQEPHSTETQ